MKNIQLAYSPLAKSIVYVLYLFSCLSAFTLPWICPNLLNVDDIEFTAMGIGFMIWGGESLDQIFWKGSSQEQLFPWHRRALENLLS